MNSSARVPVPWRCDRCDAPIDNAATKLCSYCHWYLLARGKGHIAHRQGCVIECCLCDASGSIDGAAPRGQIFESDCPNGINTVR